LRHPRKIEPIIMDDVRALVIHAAVHTTRNWYPRWVRLHRPGKSPHSVYVMVDGIDADAYRFCKDMKKFMDAWADVQVEVMTPMKYGSTALDDLCRDKISNAAKKILIRCKNKEWLQYIWSR
jgi:hypothetical protein